MNICHEIETMCKSNVTFGHECTIFEIYIKHFNAYTYCSIFVW